MACSSPKKRAVSNLLALVDQRKGLKEERRERRWCVKKEEKEQLEGEKRNEATRQSEETRISQDKAAGRTWDGSATPAVQWGSVPRRLFFTALQ